MTTTWTLVYVLIAGLLLGGIYFGGLWWTVCEAAASTQPAILFFVSLLIRTGIVLAGFYFTGRGQGTRFLICLLGFIMARLLVTSLTRERQGFHAS
jgi:F1F0 ATPase subunit 2